MDEDESKSLEYILENYANVGQVHSYFIKCTGSNGIYYGRLDVEQGSSEELDDHCEQCFNDKIAFFRFAADKKLCNVIAIGTVGLRKFNYFKNDLNKILGNTQIIDTIE